MSRRRAEAEVATAPALPARLSDSIVSGNMKLAGMVRTTNGYAVAVVELTSEGKLVSMKVGNSQVLPQFVAPAAKSAQAALAQEVQQHRPGRVA